MKHEEDPHALAGAYALDALGGEERRAFASHLERCPACALEVAGFRATSAALASAVGLSPPTSVRRAVLCGIGSVRQSPPPTRPERAVGPFALLIRRAGPVVLAACVAAAAFGSAAVWQHQRIAQARPRALLSDWQVRELSAVMTAPDARTVYGRTRGGATVSVVTSALLNRSVFVASGLPPAPAGKVYQLWFDDHGTMRPAGSMRHDGAVLLRGDTGQALAVGLTLEPEAGSPRPSSSPLTLLNVRA
ncbi:anti-sigma factor [Streptomyces sp. H27-S2]|uniref:anti-sigma factor n=1 Tax=Streptomyces antarcticus TaxID=2996458 RepID=UPI00226D94FE|nr:anti-sigma factor [Streptomyces sp. H27-S2]MCY0953351.1 anti-sigma factor [Streptomyces sp. H27-S2]